MSHSVPQPPDSTLAEDRRIAGALRVTWDAFFGRFGRLTAAQRAAIAPILAGEDVLLCAATASGKTEAACAPLIESRYARTQDSTVLYLSPTRALVNDLYERLTRPLQELGIGLARRTGDHPLKLSEPPRVLLTTPESLDSMLCRGRRALHGHFLSCVDAVVLDEIHLIHGTARGEHSRWLLERLRLLRQHAHAKGWSREVGLQIVALSATVSHPEEVRNQYLPAGGVVTVGGGRSIEEVDRSDPLHATEHALPRYLRQGRGSEKVLVFANSRARVEALVYALRESLEGTDFVVRAHHGSLGREERERTEDEVRRKPKIVVVATSTLEIGIDIGDIDLVVLDKPAPNIPALLQRIGRGNRRTDVTRVMVCGDGAADRFVHDAMLEAARTGWLGPASFGPQHAVARQQVASYIYQGRSRARSRAKLQDLLNRCAHTVVATSLLDHMVATGELLEGGDGIRLGDEWLEAAGAARLHSNIEDAPGQAVVDRDTGRVIAKGISFRGGQSLTVGGTQLDVHAREFGVLEVRPRADRDPAREGKWRFVTRGRSAVAGQPAAIRRFLGLATNEWPTLEFDGVSYVFHLGGGRMQAVLDLVRSAPGFLPPDSRSDPWCIRFPGGTARPEALDRVTSAVLTAPIAASLARLERTLGRARSNHRLPDPVRRHEIAGWLDLERAAGELRESVWVAATDTVVISHLRKLVEC